MRYYKSENSKKQIDEAIKILRNAIKREYKSGKNENSEYRTNIEELKSTKFLTLTVKLDLRAKIFHPSQRKYQLSQLARKKDELRQKNENLISANPRVQLAETIKDSFTEIDADEINVAVVYAIEQLLQEPVSMSIPDYAKRAEFIAELNKANVGIGKLKRASATSTINFEVEKENLLEQFDNNYEKCIYSDDIVSKSAKRCGENSQEVNVLRSIHREIIEGMESASSEVSNLQSKVLEELEKYGIKTGLDTAFQTFWKGFKEKSKMLFKKVFHRDKSESLPAGTDAQKLEEGKNDSDKFRTDLQSLETVSRESKQLSPQKPKINNLENLFGDDIDL